MSESKYNYMDGLVCCTECGVLIGEYVAVGEETWLQVGAVKLSAAHGICMICASEYHFSASEKTLERIIERCKRRKNVV